MRSIRFLALATGALMLGSACGGDGGGVEPNDDPVAAFTAAACTEDLACAFTDASTDDVAVTGWSWNFDDNTPLVTDQNPSHIFAEAGSYDVQLTVTDGGGKTNSKTTTVTVAPGTPGNAAPVAAFTYSCSSLDCTFTDGSTDDGVISTYAWDFGDGISSDLKDPTHSFTAAVSTPFNVKLTVTDDDGASNSVTQVVTITPPAAGQCDNGSGIFVDCTLNLTQKSHIKVTMVSNDCTAKGNTLTISTAAGFTQTLFSNGCNVADGTEFHVNGTNGTFEAGTQLRAQVKSGSTDPERVPPSLRISGVFPTWNLEFDDGENPTGPGEPDFNDLVLRVDATVVP